MDMRGRACRAECVADRQRFPETRPVGIGIERKDLDVAQRDARLAQRFRHRRHIALADTGIDVPRGLRDMGEQADMIAAQFPRDRDPFLRRGIERRQMVQRKGVRCR